MRKPLSIALVLALCGSCSGVPWGENPIAKPVPSELICPGGPQPTPKDTTPPEPSAGDARLPGAIQEVLRSKLEAYQSCYITSMWWQGEHAGRVQIAFVIGDSGRVENACVEEPVIPEGDVVRCILDEVKGLAFGPGKKTRVVYPLKLVPMDPMMRPE